MDAPRIQWAAQGETLECQPPNGDRGWSCPLSSIVLIAEYTSDEGPMCDDYFLIFWTWEEGRLFRAQVTCDADGTDQTVRDLSRLLHSEIDMGLTGSTDWISRIMWPPELSRPALFHLCRSATQEWARTAITFALGTGKTVFRIR